MTYHVCSHWLPFKQQQRKATPDSLHSPSLESSAIRCLVSLSLYFITEEYFPICYSWDLPLISEQNAFTPPISSVIVSRRISAFIWDPSDKHVIWDYWIDISYLTEWAAGIRMWTMNVARKQMEAVGYSVFSTDQIQQWNVPFEFNDDHRVVAAVSKTHRQGLYRVHRKCALWKSSMDFKMFLYQETYLWIPLLWAFWSPCIPRITLPSHFITAPRNWQQQPRQQAAQSPLAFFSQSFYSKLEWQ